MDPAHRRAFEEFVQRSSHALYRTAYLLAGDQHRAQDLLQADLAVLPGQYS